MTGAARATVVGLKLLSIKLHCCAGTESKSWTDSLHLLGLHFANHMQTILQIILQIYVVGEVRENGFGLSNSNI